MEIFSSSFYSLLSFSSFSSSFLYPSYSLGHAPQCLSIFIVVIVGKWSSIEGTVFIVGNSTLSMHMMYCMTASEIKHL